MSITLDQDEKQCLVRLEGDLDITCAAELRKTLQESLGSGKAVQVDLERVTGLDITAVQLFWAAQREAVRLGVGLALRGDVPETIEAALRDACVEKFPVPAEAR